MEAKRDSDSVEAPMISVIVPVYKVENYLPQCIESVLAQTFTDFELILVDDGSPDNSGRICDEYAQKDARIRVFHKENGGVSSARNLGIDNALGRWISFVDSDDFVTSVYLENLIKDIKRSEDFPISGIIFHDTQGKENLPRTTTEKEIVDVLSRGTAFSDSAWAFLILQGGPVCKLFSREILNKRNLRFDARIHLGEDQCFFVEYLLSVERLVFTGTCDYFYLWETGRGSLTTFQLKNPWNDLLVGFVQEKKVDFLLNKWGIRRAPSKAFRHAFVWQAYNRALLSAYKSAKDFSISRGEARAILRQIYGRHHCFSAMRSAPISFAGSLMKWFLIATPVFVGDLILRRVFKTSFAKTRTVAVNFADKKFRKAQWWNSKSAKFFGKVDCIQEFSPESIDLEFKTRNASIFAHSRGAGLWLWKPYIIKKTLETLQDGDALIYLDSGAVYLKEIFPLIACLKRDCRDLMLFEIPPLEKYFTKRETFIELNAENPSFAETPQIQGTVMVIISSSRSRAFVDEWLKCAQNEVAISPEKFREDVKEFPELVAHREDQSVLSVLSKKWGIEPYRDPTQYGDRPWEYAGRKWKSVYRENDKSTYSTTFLLFRKENPIKMIGKEVLKKILYSLGILTKQRFLKKYGVPAVNFEDRTLGKIRGGVTLRVGVLGNEILFPSVSENRIYFSRCKTARSEGGAE